MINSCRAKMLNGEKTIGTFFHMGSSTGVECLGLAGFDYLVIDTEHGPFDMESASDYVRAAKLRNITPFARIRDSSRSSVLRMLDIGVEGLVVPYVHTVDEVKKLVEYGKYYPVGLRGVAFGRGAGWGSEPFAQELTSYFETCNRETLLIPQCETMGCLENIEEITQIEGVDGIFIGPFDLSVALGRPAVFDDKFQESIQRILNACKKAGKFAMIFANDAAAARAQFERGFDSVGVQMDTVLLIRALKSLIADVRG